MDEQTYQDLEVAEQAIQIKERTLVFVDNGKVFSAFSKRPVPTLLNEIEYASDTVIGIHFLGKASALLCAYGKVRAVFTKQATKTALAVLIRAGIPCQTDKMIAELPKESPLFDMYEQQVQPFDDPKEWFSFLQKSITKEL